MDTFNLIQFRAIFIRPLGENSVEFIKNTKHFIYENASEYIVFEMMAILSGGNESSIVQLSCFHCLYPQ